MTNKILIIHNRAYHASGPETYLEKISKLKNADIFSFRYNGKVELPGVVTDRPRPLGDDTHYKLSQQNISPFLAVRIALAAFFNFSAFFKLLKLLLTNKYDYVIVIQYFGKLSPSVLVACRIFNLKVFIRQSDYGLICANNTFLNDRKYCDECVRSSSSLLKNNCKNSLLKSVYFFLLMWHNKLILKFCGPTLVWTNLFAYNTAKTANFISRLDNQLNYTFSDNIDVSDISTTFSNTFLCAGRVSPDKGVDKLIGAFKPEHGHLSIVGDIDDEFADIFPNLLHSKNEFITYDGIIPREKMAEQFRNIKYTVIASDWVDNLPNSLIESYSRGIPCIMPDYGSFTEFIIDQNLTFSDEASLQVALKYASEITDNRYAELKRACLDMTLNKFNSKTHEKFYEF